MGNQFPKNYSELREYAGFTFCLGYDAWCEGRGIQEAQSRANVADYLRGVRVKTGARTASFDNDPECGCYLEGCYMEHYPGDEDNPVYEWMRLGAQIEIIKEKPDLDAATRRWEERTREMYPLPVMDFVDVPDISVFDVKQFLNDAQPLTHFLLSLGSRKEQENA